MSDMVRYAIGAIVVLHGLIHLMGFAAYLKLAKIEALPYKTTLLDGHWRVGDQGMRVMGVLWLVATVGFLIATGGLALDSAWWPAMMLCVAVLSFGLTVLDYDVAYVGAAVNVPLLFMGVWYLFLGSV